MDQYIGKLLDNRYELLERIGNGGMAVNESGKSYLVVKVDTVEKTAVIEL